jgi:hypothetical protein
MELASENRNMPNNKLDIAIRDNEKGTGVLTDVAISGERNVIKQEAENTLKYKDLTIYIQSLWKCKNKSDTSNNRGDWNHLKIIQKIPERHNWKVIHHRRYRTQTHVALQTHSNVQVLHHGQ